MADASSDIKDIKTSALTLPAYVLVRPEGLFIKLAPPPAQDIFQLFVDRLFSNGSRFAGLDYDCFLHLLFDAKFAALQNSDATEVRLANGIVPFPPPRKALYRGVKIINNGERAEYMFEPAFLELVSDEPAQSNPEDADKPEGSEIAATTEPEPKIEMQPTQLDFDEFVADIWLKGVRFGIDAKSVRDAIQRGSTERMDIAFQLEPTESKDAEIHEENEFLHRDNAPAILADGKADLRRAKNRFPQVAKNSPLLRKIPRVLGKPGLRVTGAVIEPHLPQDIDLLKLAGEGTRIESGKDGEFILAAMDGFLSLDDETKKILVTEQIENKGGISAKSTGDIKLSVEKYIEHGEVQEGRVVEGKHMTFLSDIFGTVISRNGNIELGKNISGGRAVSVGGNVNIKNNAINSSLEAWDGRINVKFAEDCTITGKIVTIERAVNCEIVAEELHLSIAEGCAIAGKNIQIASSNVRKDRETIVSILLPDLASFDQQIATAQNNLAETRKELQAETLKLTSNQPASGFTKYLAIAEKIRAGEIQLNDAQQFEWKNLTYKYAPLMQTSDALMEKCQAQESEIVHLSQARKDCGAGENCKIDDIKSDTVVRKLSSNLGMSFLRDMPTHELKALLQKMGTSQDRIFFDDKGSFEWHFQVPESPA